MASIQPDELPVPVSENTSTSVHQQEAPSEPAPEDGTPQPTTTAPPLSKNALKRIRRNQEWEDGKEDRKKKRKEKRQERRVRQRDERQALRAQGINPWANIPRKPTPINVPISLIMDCDFEQYMREKEIISLGSQVTRAYSENRTARFRANLYVSDFKGRLFERFRDVLESKHELWKGIKFLEGDFVECAKTARERMKERPGTVIEPLQKSLDEKVSWVRDQSDPFPMPEPEPEPREEYKDIVYLSSDSPYTLERLEPYTSYVIGGIVDKNREKGLCYKRARERGIRTAKLPIGQYLVMQSRQVLATNHVVEIMLKWLEYEDWGKAFVSVIPKRKGGQLREQEGAEGAEGAEDAEGGGEEQEGDENDEAEGEKMAVDAEQGQEDAVEEKGIKLEETVEKS